MSQERRDAVIAGVNKAGTTSLFVALSDHPAVAPSAVKETRFFLPARYGRPLEPTSVWEDYFDGAPADAPGDLLVRLEATPSHVYGGAAVASAMQGVLHDPRAIFVLREPVSRAISFFTYQKVRLRIPAEQPITEYLAHADALGPDAFSDPVNEPWFAVGGGCYADFLAGWIDTFGADRILVVDFDRWVNEQAAVRDEIATWLGLDPAAFPADDHASENRTTGYKSAGLQKVALAGNDRLERMFRRHPGVKRKLRSLYYRVNGRSASEEIPQSVRDDLAQRFVEPNRRLARLLREHHLTVPGWLADQVPAATDSASGTGTGSGS
ncbi:MAG: hypothetical protein U0W40_15325 [Acidimicrobiia bacterium]